MDYLVDEGIETDDPDAADVRLGRYLDDGSPSACASSRSTRRAGGYTYADFGDVARRPRGPRGRGDLGADAVVAARRADRSYDNVEIGTARARRYITAGLRLAPPEPSFLEMRNAILPTSVEDGDDLASVERVRRARHGLLRVRPTAATTSRRSPTSPTRPT